MAGCAYLQSQGKLENQCDDVLSPPLFLMLAVLLSHGIEIALPMQVQATCELSRTITGTEQGLPLYRSVAFALWPLIASVHMLRRSGARISRDSLRQPFFAQCYLAAAFAVPISTGNVLIRLPGERSTEIGYVQVALACARYLAQAIWLKGALRLGGTNTLSPTLWIMVAGLGINTLFAVFMTGWN